MTEKILSKKSTIRKSLTYLPSPPPEGDRDADGVAEYTRKFRHDVLVDFANLESSLIRIQLILSSNQRERERYATEKAKIMETAQAVRNNTVELRTYLVEAQRILHQRKGYDEQASKILDDRRLKSRDETRSDIEKLEKEIEDLQQESAEYETTWFSRREHFNAVTREGDAMIRLIKGIKDDPEPEPDKDENMEDVEDGEDDGKTGTGRFESPGPDGRSPRPTDMGDSTPMPESGDAGDTTPRPTNKFLDIDDPTRTNSRISSPLVQPTPMQDDVDMEEANIAPGTPTGQTDELSKSNDGTEMTTDQFATPQAFTPIPDVAMDDT